MLLKKSYRQLLSLLRFSFPFCPWPPKKAATGPFVILSEYALRADRVLSTVLGSKVSPGVCSLCAQLCSPRGDSPPGRAGLQSWRVSKGHSVCLQVFCRPFDAHRGEGNVGQAGNCRKCHRGLCTSLEINSYSEISYREWRCVRQSRELSQYCRYSDLWQ